ncbi:hypothetical protein CTKA_02289 [Chthonomonas calidirosea]|uniref:Uncharacterized protein n=4 Tax=Chthonomonas TaxID=1077265 RepID=S0EW06_CHTCT|nr:hypothetical protein CCALI_01805 [Chthonomonas calidirosea T49]CEK19737.1 hypothetical protein CTKA_02289 [Chthonomonas calidirosea]
MEIGQDSVLFLLLTGWHQGFPLLSCLFIGQSPTTDARGKLSAKGEIGTATPSLMLVRFMRASQPNGQLKALSIMGLGFSDTDPSKAAPALGLGEAPGIEYMLQMRRIRLEVVGKQKVSQVEMEHFIPPQLGSFDK